jgi:hypothetical protein
LAVTTALCADRATAAAPTPRPHASHLAGRIVDRLTRSFGQSAITAQVMPRQRALNGRTIAAPPAAPAAVSAPSHLPLSPFQFRLPPPAL